MIVLICVCYFLSIATKSKGIKRGVKEVIKGLRKGSKG